MKFIEFKKPVFLVALLFFYSLTFAKVDKLRLMVAQKTSTEMILGWNQISGNNPKAVLKVKKTGKIVANFTPESQNEYHGFRNKFVRFTNLKANTAYEFFIKDSEGKSDAYWFITLPNDFNSTLSIIAGGDSRNNPKPRRNANILVSKIKPHFVMFGGDCIDRDVPGEWIEWLDDWQLTTGKDGRMTPLIMTRGNHERSNETIVNLFHVPSKDVYYATSFCNGLLRSYTLNSEIPVAGDQANWLLKDLQTEGQKVKWKIAQYHRPILPHQKNKKTKPNMYQHFAIPFYQYGVNLVVECDAHTVKHTWPLKPIGWGKGEKGFVRDDSCGITFIGEGCWGAPLRDCNSPYPWTRDCGKFDSFHWIKVDRSDIIAKTIKIENVDKVKAVSGDFGYSLPKGVTIFEGNNGGEVKVTKCKSN